MSATKVERHGTTSAYVVGKCRRPDGSRCDLCTWAWAENRRARRSPETARPDLIPAPVWFDAWADSMADSL